ncbi:hypothetical protein [Humidisolicoccus flavus]|uniref:hypothetical protein n=1 Tax=Humidisolicoccus flavus TaxID=3111414 RepID=UPI00324EAE57
METTAAMNTQTVLTRVEWQHRETLHRTRVDSLTASWVEARDAGVAHPIEDFLFTYYSYPLRRLKRWNPGAGVELLEAAETARGDFAWHVPGSSPDRCESTRVGS